MNKYHAQPLHLQKMDNDKLLLPIAIGIDQDITPDGRRHSSTFAGVINKSSTYNSREWLASLLMISDTSFYHLCARLGSGVPLVVGSPADPAKRMLPANVELTES